VVHGDIDHYHETKMFFTKGAEQFCQDVLRMESRLLARKLEGYIAVGLDKSEYQDLLNILLS
jgi:hypothetical protein